MAQQTFANIEHIIKLGGFRMNPFEMSLKIAEILYKKKAYEVNVLDVREKTTITDYMIIASGRSYPQVRSLIEAVDDKMSELEIEPIRKSGQHEARWAVLDYGAVMVHLFHEKERNFYSLDDLWQDSSNHVDLPFKSGSKGKNNKDEDTSEE